MRGLWQAGMLWLALAPVVACGDDDDADGAEGEGEPDARLDVLVNAAEGVLDGVRSVQAFYLEAGSTNCEAVSTGFVDPSDFDARREPVLAVWEGPGAPHVLAEIRSGNTQVLVQCYVTEDGTGDVQAAGCEDQVYVAPGATAQKAIQVRLYDDQ